MFQAGVKGAPSSPTPAYPGKIPWGRGAPPLPASVLAPQNSLNGSTGLSF